MILKSWRGASGGVAAAARPCPPALPVYSAPSCADRTSATGGAIPARALPNCPPGIRRTRSVVRGAEIRRRASVRRTNGNRRGECCLPSNGGRAFRRHPCRRSGRCRRRRGTDRGDAPAPGFREEEDSPPPPAVAAAPPPLPAPPRRGRLPATERRFQEPCRRWDRRHGSPFPPADKVPRTADQNRAGPPKFSGAFRPKGDHGVSVFRPDSHGCCAGHLGRRRWASPPQSTHCAP